MYRALLTALIPALATMVTLPAAEPLTFVRAVEMPGVKGTNRSPGGRLVLGPSLRRGTRERHDRSHRRTRRYLGYGG